MYTESRGDYVRATIKDVAKLANVSIASVSRVINQNYAVKEATRKRIEDAMKQLNFIPNEQARSLIMKNVPVIGVLTPSINNMFFTEVISALEKDIKQAGYSLFLVSAHHEKKQEMDGLKQFVAKGVAGIIVLDPHIQGQKTFYQQLAKQIPLVFVNGKRISDDISYIYNDEAEGTRIALMYLLEKGRKRIGFLRGGTSLSYDIKETAYRDFMHQQGLATHVFVMEGGNGTDTVEHAKTMMKQQLQEIALDALLACNDLMALGCINAARCLDLKVPEQLAVCGFDNIPLASYVTPSITTLDQNMEELGKGAALLLLEKIAKENKTSKRIICQNQLIQRNSA